MSDFVARAFARYARRYIARHFTALRIARDGPPTAVHGPVVFYSNHASWWDPLVLLVVANAFYADRHLRAPIDAEALERYPILGRCGLFGIERGTLAGTRRFLEVSRETLARRDGLLAITAQGAFADVRERPLVLERGLACLLVRAPEVRAVPVAVEYPFWNERRPEALVRFGRPIEALHPSSEAVHSRLEAALEAELDALAETAMARHARAFDVLVQGRGSGVGTWQDLPSRLRSWAARKRFDGSHGAVGRGRV